MKLIFLFALITSLHSKQHLDIVSLSKTLSLKPYWAYLLHSRDGKSEIDDKKFFFAKNGKYNLRAELEATLIALINGNNNVYCKFPARREWLLSQIPDFKKNVISKSCTVLKQFIERFNGDKITLVFPTAHINSPASMFGHTLLRIDKNNETTLISNAINYAAFTNENNGISFAFKGLFGLFEGRYATMPYYKKIKEYNALENRDIWEYTLNLQPFEIKRLLLHLYEIKDTKSDYYFFDENCSYNVLWLLQIARPSTSLMKNFNYIVPPLSTIRETSQNKMVEKVVFRHSKMRLLQHLIDHELNEKDTALKFEESDFDENFLRNYPLKEQAIILDIVINRLQYKRSKDEIDKSKYLNLFLKLLNLRSKSHVIANYEVKKPIDPLDGHFLTRVGFLGDTKGNFIGNIRLGYHDIYDLDDGFHRGAYIDFFDFDFRKNKNKKLQIEKLDFLSIASYAKRDAYFQSYSWEVSLGLKRWYKDKLYTSFKLGVGYTYGNDDSFVFMMLNPSAYIATKSHFGLGGKIGAVTSYFDGTKLGFNVSKNFFDSGIKEENIEIFSLMQLTKRINVHLRYEYNTVKEKKVLFGLSYYLNI